MLKGWIQRCIWPEGKPGQRNSNHDRSLPPDVLPNPSTTESFSPLKPQNSLAPAAVEFFPRGSARRTPFEVSDIRDLQELLSEIDKAIYKPRRPQTTPRDVAPRLVNSNVNDAKNVLDNAVQFCQRSTQSKASATKVANESYRVLCDALRGVGNLHWAAAGLSIVAFVLDRIDLVQMNATECTTLLWAMRDLGYHLVTLYPTLSDQDDKLRRAIRLITEGAVLCCSYTNSGAFKRFGFAGVSKEDLSTLRCQITLLYPDLILTELRAFTQFYERQSSMPLAPLKPEYPTSKVGLEGKVADVLEMLGMSNGHTGHPEVRAVVLHGMGGIGKSTLGMGVHARLPFTGRSHAKVEVGESPSDEKICNFQKNIMERLYRKMHIGDCSEGRQILSTYFQECPEPLLLFIDNIFEGAVLYKLLPDPLVLPYGSRLIVTSRDASVCPILEEKGIACQSYPVAELAYDEARELLCMQVFNSLYPPPHREEVVNGILHLCGGLPLALEVVGRYLNRRKGTDEAWNFAIKSLGECNVTGRKEDQLHKSLNFSYNQLAEDCQEAFLDITCLLWDQLWECVEAIFGEKLATLEELALVKRIGDVDGFVRLQVHDLLLALGRKIKRCTRVRSDGWDVLPSPLQDHHNPALCAVVEGLSVKDCSDPIHAEQLDAMHGTLRVLILQNVAVLGKCSRTHDRLQLCITTGLNGLPFTNLSQMTELQVLMVMEDVAFDFEGVQLPRHLKILRLVDLLSLKGLPSGFGRLRSLHTLEIEYCQSIQQLPEDFWRLQCLRTLILTGCCTLKELPEDFGRLQSLQTLDLTSCEQLQELPDGFGQLSALQHLSLWGCKRLTKLPDDFVHLKSLQSLQLNECKSLRTLPEGFGNLYCLQDLNLTWCERLDQLPEGFGALGNLVTLSLEHCLNLMALSADFGQLHCLETLRLSDCPKIPEIPDSFLQLRRLRLLDVSRCQFRNMELLEELKRGGCRVVDEQIVFEDDPDFTDHESSNVSPFFPDSGDDDYLFEEMLYSNNANGQSQTPYQVP